MLHWTHERISGDSIEQMLLPSLSKKQPDSEQGAG
jgi:hypothetical protein